MTGDESGTSTPTPRRRRRGGATEVIGNALVGFDYAVFRATKPPAILVEAAKPVRGLSGEGGRLLSIDFPEDAPPDAPPVAFDRGLG
ncbi:MAG: hypothetical protein H0U52_03370 [Chloroflexi bacterium]|nr:hypothetical protein [Chloroflexota bacterium]